MKTHVPATLFTILFLATAAQAQNLDLNPQVGEIVTNYPLSLQHADTGSNGSGQTWDFSAFGYDDSPITWTYRLPTSDELIDFPLANLTSESETEGTRFYNVSADSLAYAGRDDGSSSPLIHTNMQRRAIYPFTAGETYRDTARYHYMSGATLVEVDVYTEWSIVGSGTLMTPLATYPSVWKVRTASRLEFNANGLPILVVHVEEYDWYDEAHRTSLLYIAHDDYNDETISTFMGASGTAGIGESGEAPISVFPNPVIDQLTVDAAFDRYALVDGMGRIVRTGTEQTIVVSDLPDGQYVLQLYGNGSPTGCTNVIKVSH